MAQAGCKLGFLFGRMRKLVAATFIFLTCTAAQAALPLSYQAQSGKRIAGNSIIEILFDGTNLWVGTNNGISKTSDGGVTWEIFNSSNNLNSDEMSALGYRPGTLLAAGAHSEIINDFEVPFGEGFNITTDGGAHWSGVRPFQASSPGMVAYDIASADTVFYASCFFGGLIRSWDGGQNWENLFVDFVSQQDFQDSTFAILRNRYFSVVADTSKLDTTIIWAGSAYGIQKIIFTDSSDFDIVYFYRKIDSSTCAFEDSFYCDSGDVAIGFHIERETFYCGSEPVMKIDTIPCPAVGNVADSDTVVQYSTITGNFVAALGLQKTSSGSALWAAARPTFDGIMAVNFTRDGGQTWDTTLTDELVWDFAFQDTIVWVATSSGLKRSSDWGKTWQNFTGMEDLSDSTRNKIFSPEFYALEAVGETLWAGGADGLVRTTDGGNTWRIYRAYQPIGSAGSTSAYAYPSPFSPHLGAGVTRIHHKPGQSGNVTVKIFDFAMNKVITLVDNQPRIGGQEWDEPWNGRDQDGDEVASGVYFFKVESPGQTQWGKVVVLK